jgi:gas vesicle protein GvpK
MTERASAPMSSPLPGARSPARVSEHASEPMSSALPGARSPAPVREIIRTLPERIESDADSVERDLFRLVLTVVELVRQLMERQALRRMDDLDDERVEALGTALMRLDAAMTELRERYGLSAADLNLDLGPLGRLVDS